MSEEMSNPSDYLPQPSIEEAPTTKFPSEPDWIYPKDFDINANIEKMNNELLEKYHDLTHIYFDRILKGAELNFRLNELILLHYKIIKEFEKRNLTHFQPINRLDEIHFSNIEYQNYLINLQKDTKETQKVETYLSFSEPTISKK